MAPGPTPTLTTSAPASTRSLTPSAETTLPATSGTRRPVVSSIRLRTSTTDFNAVCILSWWPWAVSTTRTSIPASSRAAVLPATSPLMPTAAPMRSRPDGIQRRTVKGGPEGVLERHHPGQPVAVHHQRGGQVTSGEGIEDLDRIGVGRDGQQVAGHHLVGLGEPVDPGCIGLAHGADRPAVLDDDNQTVGALGEERQRLADRGVGSDRNGRVIDGVRPLDLGHHLGDHVGGDVLRDDGDATPARDRLGHPSTRDRGHIGHHERQRGADPVGAGQIDREPGAHAGAARDHEHVGIGQVIGGGLIQEPHRTILSPRATLAR